MNLVLVPKWVTSALASENRSVSDALNLEALMSTLSTEDVAFYIWLNQHLTRWIPDPIVESFVTGSEGMGFNHKQTKQFEDLLLSFQIEENTRVKSKVFQKNTCELFGSLADPVELSEIDYSVQTLGMNTLVLMPKIGKGNTVIGTVNDLLFYLNDRVAFDELAKKPIFKFYLTNI